MNPIKPNIGTLDRYLRLSAGLIIFGSGVTGRRSSLSRYLLTTLGAAKIAEGITGWCPLMAITGGSTTGTQNQYNNNKGSMAAASRGENSSTTSSLHQSAEGHSSEESSDSPAYATSGESETHYTATDDRDGEQSDEIQDEDDE